MRKYINKLGFKGFSIYKDNLSNHLDKLQDYLNDINKIY